MTGPELITLEQIATALAEQQESWFTLPPNDVEIPEDLAHALQAFDAGDRGAAVAASEWLRTRARVEHRTSRTRLLIAEGRIAGFYSLASAHVQLSQRDRKRLTLHSTVVSVPAALVTWFAKDRRARVEGKTLLLHAAATARRAATMQAAAVLVVDAFDEETAEMWKDRFGFRRSSGSDADRRLWIPLAA
jgi:hypothetical protein